MQQRAYHITNPFQPHRDVRHYDIVPGRTINELIAGHGISFGASPTICIVNDGAVLRADWDQALADTDVVAFVALPQGGDGGSDPLNVVLQIAVTIAAVYTGQVWLANSSLWVQTAATIAVQIAGSMLVNALVPPAGLPSSHFGTSMAAPSPTYNLGAQGNQARLGQPIPVIYGRHLVYPDFGAQPYLEYASNEQYLYQLFVIGQGYFDIDPDDLKIEDTPFSSFEEIDYEIIGPGDTVSLFPTNVVTSVEVVGQEMVYNVILGPFVVNAAGTVINRIAVDMVCPRGLYYANDSGTLSEKSVSFIIQARTIDDNGSPTGSWVSIGSKTISAATTTPVRQTFRFDVADARYEVQVLCTTIKDDSSRAGHEIDWSGLRGYVPHPGSYGDITCLAVRMRATNNLSQNSSRKINLVVQRKLPVWNGTSWSSPTATRSIAWAMADAARASYGGNIPDKRINLARLLQLDAVYASRGDTFNAVFDSQQVLFAGLTQIAAAGRARPFLQAGVIDVFRDGPLTLPVAKFSPRNIVRGSFKIKYSIPTEDTVDEIIAEYFDENTWSTREVSSDLTGATAETPARLPFFGVTNRDQAYREAMWRAACNRYRRIFPQLDTELEGHIPTMGSLVTVSHVAVDWATAADVIAYSTTASVLVTVNVQVENYVAGNYYIRFRKRDGSDDGPYLVTLIAEGNGRTVFQLPAALGWTPDTSLTGGRERTQCTMGVGAEFEKMCRVLSVAPGAGNRVHIACVNEHALVHTADHAPVPDPSETWDLIPPISRPVMASINVVIGGTPENPVLHVSWPPAAGAASYIGDVSYDNARWSRVIDTSAADVYVPVSPGVIYLRVAPVGLLQGAWLTWSGNLAEVLPPGDVPSLYLIGDADGDVRTIGWSPAVRAAEYEIQVWADSTLRRTVFQLGTTYSYSVQDARGDGGPWRDIYFWVRAKNASGTSVHWTTLATNNPAPSMAGLTPTVTGISGGLLVNWSNIVPADRDLHHFILYCDRNNPPTTPYRVLDATQVNDQIFGLELEAGYYVQIEPWDSFGAGIKSNVVACTPPLIGAADVDLTLAQSVEISDSYGTVQATLDQLYDRNNASGGPSYAMAGTDHYINYQFAIGEMIDRSVVWLADSSARMYFALSDDGTTWSWYRANTSHSLTDGTLIAAADQASARTNYLQGVAGFQVARFPGNITAAHCRLYLTGSYTTQVHELVFVREIVAEQMVADNLSAISANLGAITAGYMQSAGYPSSGVQIDLDNSVIHIGGSTGGVSSPGFSYDPVNFGRFYGSINVTGIENVTETQTLLNVEDGATNTTFTSQLTDDAGLGLTATWGETITNKPSDLQLFNNLLDQSQWLIGSEGSQGTFTKQGLDAESRIILGVGPYGYTEPLWQAVPSGDGVGDGGWSNCTFDLPDHTKSYRMAAWVKKTESSSGTTYLGCSKTTTNNLDGTPNINPYFLATNLPALDKWFLMVGVLHGSGYAGADSGMSGIYDPATGVKVVSGTEYKIIAGSTTQSHRCFLFSCLVASARQYHCRPRVDILDGNEPSLASLMSPAAVFNSFISISSNGLLTGAGGGQVTIAGLGGIDTATFSSLATQVDNKISVYVLPSTTPPTWSDDDANHVDDQWYKTDELKWYKYSGSAWIINDQSIFDLSEYAAGKTTIHYGSTVPLDSLGIDGDYFAQDDGTTVTFYKKVAGSWLQTGTFTSGADVTLDQLSGNGVNLCHPRYSTFEEAELPPFVKGYGTVSLDTGFGYFGSQSLKMSASSTNHYCFLGSSSTDYNIKVTPGKKYIYSGWMACDLASKNFQPVLKFNDGTQLVKTLTSSATPLEFTRFSTGIDASALTSQNALLMRIDNEGGAGCSMWFDGLMLEERIGAGTEPSTYSAPHNFMATDDFGIVQANAAAAASAVTDMEADGILSVAEKTTWRTMWPGMQQNYANILTRAGELGISSNTDITAFSAAWDTLYGYLYTTLQIASNPGASAAISPSDQLSTFTADFYGAMADAVSAISVASVTEVDLAAQINANTTTINGGKITTGSVTALELTGTKLNALYAYTGALTVDDVLTVGSTGAIKMGKPSYGSSTAGIWAGYDGGYYKFHVGTTGQFFAWNGTAALIGGDVIATGNIHANNITLVSYDSFDIDIPANSTSWTELASVTIDTSLHQTVRITAKITVGTVMSSQPLACQIESSTDSYDFLNNYFHPDYAVEGGMWVGTFASESAYVYHNFFIHEDPSQATQTYKINFYPGNPLYGVNIKGTLVVEVYKR